jgi:hypothetical protein
MILWGSSVFISLRMIANRFVLFPSPSLCSKSMSWSNSISRKANIWSWPWWIAMILKSSLELSIVLWPNSQNSSNILTITSTCLSWTRKFWRERRPLTVRKILIWWTISSGKEKQPLRSLAINCNLNILNMSLKKKIQFTNVYSCLKTTCKYMWKSWITLNLALALRAMLSK